MITAKSPDTAIASPAWPSETARSRAIGVRRLTGMNSNPTRRKVRSERQVTAAHGVAARSAEGVSPVSVRWPCRALLSVAGLDSQAGLGATSSYNLHVVVNGDSPMPRDEFSEMRAFLEVARERSFTRAAAKLGVTRSALSHTIRALEERLGIRLLSRTTRDVAPTAAGERLVESIEPHFEGIAAEISAISALRDKPSGHVRIVCPDDAIDMVFRPRLPAFLRDYPDINVELVVDNGFTNIVERQFDAGVRLGEAIARDMVAVRIGADVRYAVVGSPDYFARRSAPGSPQDLTDHNCINLRLPTSGAIYAWEFKKDGTRVQRSCGWPIDAEQYRPGA